MKILYGIQATGNGHITRARHLVPALRAAGAEVDCIFSGREAQQYFDMQVFGNYRLFEGLSFKTQQGRIDPWRTATSLNLWKLYQEVRSLDVSNYDLVLTDFEPISAWAAKRQGVSSIGISHQMSFIYPQVPKRQMKVTDRWLIQHFAPAQQRIALHWHHFGADILPPIAEPPQAQAPQRGEFLVYLPFEEPQAIRELLAPFDDCRFYIYHPQITQQDQQQHLWWLPLCRDGFQQRLSQVQGVIANSGFELTSEVLQLGVQLLVKPLQGQFEQVSNAQALLDLGLADVMWQLDHQVVAQWMQRPAVGKVFYPNVAQALAQWLVTQPTAPLNQLVSQLWQQTCFPPSCEQQINRAATSEA